MEYANEDEWGISSKQEKEPVILVKTRLLSHLCCIWGHARIAKTYKEKGKCVDMVYHLSEEEHLSLMGDSLSKAMYMFYCDLLSMVKSPSLKDHLLYIEQCKI